MCSGCGSPTARTSFVRCRACATRQRAEHKCSDCGLAVHPGSVRCKACSAKQRTRPRPHCLGCGVGIGLGATRCLSCHNKSQDKGLSRERAKFNVSDLWKRARIACFDRDGYTCQACNRRGGELNAHHRLTWADYPQLRLNLDNLTTLCSDCHRGHHAYRRIFNEVCGGGPDG